MPHHHEVAFSHSSSTDLCPFTSASPVRANLVLFIYSYDVPSHVVTRPWEGTNLHARVQELQACSFSTPCASADAEYDAEYYRANVGCRMLGADDGARECQRRGGHGEKIKGVACTHSTADACFRPRTRRSWSVHVLKSTAESHQQLATSHR